MRKIIFGAIATAVVAIAAVVCVPPPREASAQFYDQATYGKTSSGSANAQTITIGNYSAHTPGIVLRFVPGFTNTGPTQVNISGLGLVNVTRPSSIGNVAFSGGEFQAGEPTCVTWTGSAYQLACNVDLTPVGSTLEGRFASAPRGYMIEDGSCVSRTTFAPLFSVIGTTYGACDGSTTFALPDSRGTMLAALDNQGSTGSANRITAAGSGCNATSLSTLLCGAQTQTLTLAQLPTGITASGSGTMSGSMSGSNSITVNVAAGRQVLQGNTPLSSFFASAGSGFFVPQASAVWEGVSSFSGTNTIGVSGSVNGSVSTTSNNTSGAAHPILPPVSLIRRAIKF